MKPIKRIYGVRGNTLHVRFSGKKVRLSACEINIGMEIVYLITNNRSVIGFEIENEENIKRIQNGKTYCNI